MGVHCGRLGQQMGTERTGEADLEVVEADALVLGHQAPVVLEEGLEARPVRLRVQIGEHVRGAVLRVAAGRESLPEVLEVLDGCVWGLERRGCGDEVGKAVVRPGSPAAVEAPVRREKGCVCVWGGGGGGGGGQGGEEDKTKGREGGREEGGREGLMVSAKAAVRALFLDAGG